MIAGRCLDLKFLDYNGSVLADFLTVEDTFIGVILDVFQSEVLSHGKIADGALMSILRGASNPGIGDLTGCEVRDIPALKFDGTLAGGNQASDHLGQFTLAVAGDTGDSKDLAFADTETYVIQDFLLVFTFKCDPAEFLNWLSGFACILQTYTEGFTTDHHFCQFNLVGFGFPDGISNFSIT